MAAGLVQWERRAERMNGLVDSWIVETKRDWTNPSIHHPNRSAGNPDSPNGLARWLFPAIIVALVGA
jgi:hypothetical protein